MTEITGSFPQACLDLPPVEFDYKPKGTYTDFTGLKTYIIGDDQSKKAILIIPDIFGVTAQALQGADLLSSQGFKVYLPDVFKGDTADKEKWAKNPKLQEDWRSRFPGDINTQIKPIGDLIRELKKKYKKVGAAGFCWGYKALICCDGMNDLDAIGTAHPSKLADDDAEKITCPIAFLRSNGESLEQIQSIYDKLSPEVKKKSFIKDYANSIHGWMGARAQLNNPEEAETFRDGYSTLSAFFTEILA